MVDTLNKRKLDNNIEKPQKEDKNDKITPEVTTVYNCMCHILFLTYFINLKLYHESLLICRSAQNYLTSSSVGY